MKRLTGLAGLLIAISSIAQQKNTNPVLDTNFPDPTVIQANGKYYAYATNSRGLHIQVALSTDLQHWTIVGDALPQVPSWASHDFWAPHVLYDKVLKRYVMFYSGESKDTSTGKCLGVALSNAPEGPFIDKGEPLLCGETFVNIDPMAFIDPKSGKRLLYWGSGFEPIKVQEMTNDWTAFKPGTTAKPIVFPKKETHYDRLIEGAWVHYYKGNYYIYYSGDNCCGVNASYAVLVARAKNPFGPFTTYGEANGTGSSVVLEKNETWTAPGHNSIFSDNKGNMYIAYHAIAVNKEASQKGWKRVFCIDPVVYKKGWPVVLK